jgi:hypothetical protein
MRSILAPQAGAPWEGTCLNPIWTDRGNGPAAARSARYLQFLLADGIHDAATAQVTVTADQDPVRAAQDQQCSSSAAERCSRSATAASPNNEVANTPQLPVSYPGHAQNLWIGA